MQKSIFNLLMAIFLVLGTLASEASPQPRAQYQQKLGQSTKQKVLRQKKVQSPRGQAQEQRRAPLVNPHPSRLAIAPNTMPTLSLFAPTAAVAKPVLQRAALNQNSRM